MTVFRLMMEWLFMIKDRWLYGNWETRSIYLTNGECAIIDAEDYFRISLHTWRRKSVVARNTTFQGRQITYHLSHVILNCTLSRNLVITYKNGDLLDCRKVNLIVAQKSQVATKGVRRTGRFYRGVVQHFNKFHARIRSDGRKLYLGSYDTPEDAAMAYNRAALELFGEFAQLNFKEEPQGERILS